jgi:Asp-tRNA(Asn)/Glu-tRNA(Gln) amidotransferase B subunit
MSDDVITHFDVIVNGDWITGKSRNEKSGFVWSWSKLTDEAYLTKFWFIEPPIAYLKRYGIDIDLKTSDALVNLCESSWVDFCHMLSACENKEDAIKLFIGPVAAIAKETGVAALKVTKREVFIRLVNDKLTFNQKKAMLPELSEDYDIVRSRHAFAEISDDDITAALKDAIEANPEQWANTQTKPALRNWFVGQVMKKCAGKIDASRVKTILDTM